MSGFALGHRSVEAIAADRRRSRFSSQPKNTNNPRNSWPDIYPAKVSALVGVSSFSGSDLLPGSGSVELYYLNAAGVLKKQEIGPQTVRHRTFRKFIVGEWVDVAQDPGGNYWIVVHTHKAMFKTPVGGIAARTGSSSPYTPGVASCERYEYYLDSGTLKIRATGINDDVANMVPTAVAAGKIIQVGLIDGRWTIDVDPC